MPQAQTATDRLIMRGENITLETIGQTVTDGFEKVSHNVNDYIKSDKHRNFFQKTADLIVSVFGFLLKFVAILIGIILLPILLLVVFILFIVGIALIAGGTSVIYSLFPAGCVLINGMPVYMTAIGCIGIILLIGIPVVALFYTVCGHFFNLKPMTTPVKWTLLVLWLISVAGCIVYLVNIGLPTLSGI